LDRRARGDAAVAVPNVAAAAGRPASMSLPVISAARSPMTAIAAMKPAYPTAEAAISEVTARF
jgi:hypothetical protein